jgi:hypothetical protein
MLVTVRVGVFSSERRAVHVIVVVPVVMAMRMIVL